MGRPTITIEILASARKAKADIDSLQNHIGSRFGSIKAKAAVATAAIAGVAVGAVRVGKSLIEAGETAGTSNARIGQVAKSMGLFGGETQRVTDRLVKLANVTARQTGVDQNQIKLTQAKLMSFKELAVTAGNVGDHFDRATKAAVDMGAAGFGTAEQNAVQLGKALNDPIKGITALARSGVTFTEAEKEKIKTLVESNKMHEAQALVLSAIEKQVGGVAKTTANGTEKIKVAWSQVKEKLGTSLVPMVDKLADFINGKAMPAFDRWAETSGKKLGPALEKLGNFITTVIFPTLVAAIPVISQIGRATLPLIQQIASMLIPALQHLSALIAAHPALFGALAAAIAGVAGGFKLFAAGVTIAKVAANGMKIVQLALNAAFAANPIGLVITIIAALVAALITAWQTNEGFRNAVIGAWNAIKTATTAVWGAIVNFFTAVWDGIKAAFIGYLTFYVTYWKTAWTIIKTVFITIWNAIKAFATAVWNFIKAFFTAWIKGYIAIWTTVWNGIKAIFQSVWNGIKAFATAVWNAIKAFFTAWLTGAKTMWNAVWTGAKTIFVTVFKTIKTVATNVLNGIKTLFKTVFVTIPTLIKNAFMAIVNTIRKAFENMVNAVKNGIAGVMKWVQGLGQKILAAIGNLAGILTAPGRAIMDGFLNGIKSGFDAVKGFVNGIAGWIKEHKGPKAKDLGLLVPAGKWIMTGLLEGIESQRANLGELLGEIADDVTGARFGAPIIPAMSLAGVGTGTAQNVTINVQALTPTMEVGRVVADALSRFTTANGRGI